MKVVYRVEAVRREAKGGYKSLRQNRLKILIEIEKQELISVEFSFFIFFFIQQ